MYIREVDLSWDKIIREGYDSDHSPLGCPVYWRVVTRGGEQFYWTTFMATRAQVSNGWGTDGLAHCDAITGMAVARMEKYLGDERLLIHDVAGEDSEDDVRSH